MMSYLENAPSNGRMQFPNGFVNYFIDNPLSENIQNYYFKSNSTNITFYGSLKHSFLSVILNILICLNNNMKILLKAFYKHWWIVISFQQ